MPELRAYQAEDYAAVLAAHVDHQIVLGRAATGLGKAVLLAALAAHYAKAGRVMVLVDRKKLVAQLATTIAWFTGVRPGIEMGDQSANNGGGTVAADQIIVSTVQSQYSGSEGQERFRKFKPNGVSCLLLDETELFLAKRARSVVDYYVANADLRVCGVTATPMRGDGQAMANLFSHVAFDRDVVWGLHNGYLVPASQAFVRVSLDLSTAKVVKNDAGETDYSDDDLAERITNEQTLIELAKGIIHVAGDRRSIVVCPNVASAKAVANYLETERTGCAKCIYGQLDDTEREDVFDGHQRGEFQFLTSCQMLTTGYDDPGCSAVFVCRPTKSKRLYQQIIGRVLRPARDIACDLGQIDTAEQRCAAVASSVKPRALVVNMVGISAKTRDMTITDILGTAKPDEVVERAKELQAEDETLDTEEALAQAEQQIEAEQAVAWDEAEAASESLDASDIEDEYERRMRKRVAVQASVDVEYREDLGGGHAGGGTWSPTDAVPASHRAVLERNKVKPDEVARMSADQVGQLCRELIARHKVGLCTWRQGQTLKRNGYTKAELRTMSKAQAGAAIDALAANGWRRPEVAA